MSVDLDYTPQFKPGMRPEIQQFYRPNDRSPWSGNVPDKTAADIQANSYAQECVLIVHREFHPITNAVSLYSITVQSPLARKALDKIFQGYKGISTRLKQLVFEAPFHPFYYRWHRFEQLLQTEQDEETKSHLDLLHSAINEEIMPHIQTMEDLTKNDVITFDHLWAIFVPDTQVYTQIDGQDCLVELMESHYGASMGGEFFTLEFRYIDCDGSRFGYVSSSLDIDKFDGVKRIVQYVTPGYNARVFRF